jgi:hypothetical protein
MIHDWYLNESMDIFDETSIGTKYRLLYNLC